MINALQIVLLLLIVVAFAWISAGLLSIIWFSIRAACRKVGLSGHYLIFVPGAIFAIPVLLLLVARVDRLDVLERTCRAASLTDALLADTANLRVQEHYDFWAKTYSGSAVYPWISRPYETPKVALLVNFERDQRPNSAWIHCIFTKVPNTGEPPQLALDNVHVHVGANGPLSP
jgi:hypothetical protein